MQAAIGVAQLKKLPNFIAKRNHNFQLLEDSLAGLTDDLILPQCCPQAKPSWFGFPVTCRRTGIRGQLVRALESAGIQTRMLFAGNLTRHPCLTALDRNAFRTAVPLEQTDRVAADTFWVGVYPGLSDENVTFMAEQIKRAVKQ